MTKIQISKHKNLVLNFENLKIGYCFKIVNCKLKIASVFLALILLIANTTAVRAQGISLSIWPPLVEVQMVPGKTVLQNYQLINNSGSILEITPQISLFEPQGENGQIKLLPPETVPNDHSLYFFSFVSGEKMNQPFLLEPQKTKQISLKITLPKNSPEKDYYFTLLFSTSSPDQEMQNSQTSSVAKIGTNILLTSSRAEKPAILGRIFQFSSPKIIDSFSPTEFTVILENFGKTFFKPFGQITIKSIFKEKTQFKLLEQNVLANSKRKLLISPLKPKLPIGPFKAKLDISLNEEGALPILSTEINFWYLPYKIFFGFILGFVVVFCLKKRKDKR